MIAGISQLLRTDSYYVPYLIIAILGFLSLSWNYQKKQYEDLYHSRPSIKWLDLMFSIFFASMITLANYKLWSITSVNGILNFIAIFLGALSAFHNILFWISENINNLVWTETVSNPQNIFFITFGIIACLNLSVLFLCAYPGNLTPDSIDQMNQLLSNSYSNHHPFYHTMIIKACVWLGFRLFHDINAAVALYSVFSVFFMAASFSFAIFTIAELHAPKWIIFLLQLFFILMPFHIMYSITMWKDVFFGASVLLYVVFFFRCLKQMNMKLLNFGGLIISAFGICLLRSNGYFVFLLTAFCFLFLYKFRKKKMVIIMCFVLAGSFILKHPVLYAIGVTQPDLIESLSIPAQQIARDVVDNNDLTKTESDLLSQVIEIDKIPEYYNPVISDPIKVLVRTKGNQDYIRSNAKKFIRLYFSLGAKHPITYLRAWIDQTRGYWNAGYSYWRWADGVDENDLGIYRTVKSEKAYKILTRYLDLFQDSPTLEIFLSIGFFDWLMLFALYIAIIRKDKVGVMLTIPVIMVVFSLLVATPVYSEFRYNYAVFCTLPIVIPLVLRPESLVRGKDDD